MATPHPHAVALVPGYLWIAFIKLYPMDMVSSVSVVRLRYCRDRFDRGLLGCFHGHTFLGFTSPYHTPSPYLLHRPFSFRLRGSLRASLLRSRRLFSSFQPSIMAASSLLGCVATSLRAKLRSWLPCFSSLIHFKTTSRIQQQRQ